MDSCMPWSSHEHQRALLCQKSYTMPHALRHSKCSLPSTKSLFSYHLEAIALIYTTGTFRTENAVHCLANDYVLRSTPVFVCGRRKQCPKCGIGDNISQLCTRECYRSHCALEHHGHISLRYCGDLKEQTTTHPECLANNGSWNLWQSTSKDDQGTRVLVYQVW